MAGVGMPEGLAKSKRDDNTREATGNLMLYTTIPQGLCTALRPNHSFCRRFLYHGWTPI